jgi:hypothetical protein
MPFLQRKEKNLIPPVENPLPGRDTRPGGNSTSPRPYHSNASSYIASRDGDPYNNPDAGRHSAQQDNETPRDRYGNRMGDVYSRTGGRVEDDRNELFAGYNPEKSEKNRFYDGPQLGREPPPGEENDDDVEGIKQQTRFVKQESVNSTRNALRLAREAEDTARNTLTKLGDQSGVCIRDLVYASLTNIGLLLEKLANTELHLDVSKGHSQRADDKTDELKKLNRSIFRPVVTFNKDGKRAAQEAKVQSRHQEERDARERAMLEVRDSQNRVGRAATYGHSDPDAEVGGQPGVGGNRFKSPAQQEQRKEQRKRYQFEATASDDELEDELDNNLDEVSDVTKRLKALGMAMGQEIDAQNERITRIDDKTSKLDNRIFRNTERVSDPFVISLHTLLTIYAA